MARYAPTHQLALTEEIVPLDDRPDADNREAPQPSGPYDCEPEPEAGTTTSEETGLALAVIEPDADPSDTDGVDFDTITDADLNALAERSRTEPRTPPDSREPTAHDTPGPDPGRGPTGLQPASTDSEAEAATGTARRWDSAKPGVHASAPTAGPSRPARPVTRALAIGLLGTVLAALTIVGLTGQGSPLDRGGDTDYRATAATPPASHRAQVRIPDPAPRRRARTRRARPAHRRHQHHQRRHHGRRHEDRRQEARNSRPATVAPPTPPHAPAAPSSPSPATARSGGGGTAGGSSSSGGSGGGGERASDPTFDAGF
jgi:hypothetical protein